MIKKNNSAHVPVFQRGGGGGGVLFFPSFFFTRARNPEPVSGMRSAQRLWLDPRMLAVMTVHPAFCAPSPHAGEAAATTRLPLPFWLSARGEAELWSSLPPVDPRAFIFVSQSLERGRPPYLQLFFLLWSKVWMVSQKFTIDWCYHF